jgi:hypothetical protein
MATKTRSGNANRKNKYKNVNPRNVRRNKDKNVFKSSHGKFKTVAELEEYKKRNKKN